MKIINTSELDESTMMGLNADETSWIYNGLDCCVTSEVFYVLEAQLAEEPECVRKTYEYALDKLAPIMEMSLRGNKIDDAARKQSIMELSKELAVLDGRFQRIMKVVCQQEDNLKYYFNWRSPVQLKNFFYGMMSLKERKKRNAKGQYVPTVDAEALEFFAANYLYARPICNFILVLRDIHKQLGFLRTEIDEDGRMRTNYNLAGTNTGRLSSSMNDFGTGTNLQNVNRKLRYPFVADDGMYLCNVDLEQADGRNVGAICWNLFIDMPSEEIYELAKDDPRLTQFERDGAWIGPTGAALAGAYLDACESGDLHTTVCRMVWPDHLNGKPWPEDEAEWKRFCDGEIAHGQDSFRQLSKKGGHGTNYYGTPRTMAKHLHTSSRIIEGFQNNYFTAFPAIPLWHNYVIKQIIETGTLTTFFGRRRIFFDRGADPSTHRKAIAFEPQSCTGEQIDRGLHQVWKAFPQVQLLNQVHDSILFQVPFRQVETLLPQVLEVMQVTLELKHGRKFTVPLDAAGGWNWGYRSEKENPKTGQPIVENPYGLVKWKGLEKRIAPRFHRKKRQRLKDFL
jgi:DNA polymerase I-like protein with 3'-5' exonuclease and polymerase domains